MAAIDRHRPATHADFISIYRFLALKIWHSADFLSDNLANYTFFQVWERLFLNILFSHTDFFPKILIFLVINTDFVLDQSGRSVDTVQILRRTSFSIMITVLS